MSRVPFVDAFLFIYCYLFTEHGAQGVNIDDRHDVLALLYADDLVILAHSEIDVTRKLKILEQYTTQNNLTVNLEKTKIMQFSKGVTFTSSALFYEMSSTTVNKGKQAIGSILPIMSKAKMDTWYPRIRLFESLALSCMFNCVAVWGLRYLDILERVQVYFFKRILMISVSTPDAIVRLEAGRVKLAFNVFKFALNWLHKIWSMDNSRYPKLCLEQQLRIANFSEVKYNWAQQLRNIFIDIDCLDLWNNINSNSFASFNFYKKQLLTKYYTFLHQSDTSLTSRYSFMILHDTLNTSQNPSAYLLLKLPIQMTRTLAQLRTASNFRIKFSLNGIGYSIDPDQICSVGNSHEKETLNHLMFECPIYTVMKPNFNYLLNLESLISTLQNITITEAKTICIYVWNILKLRSFILSE